MKILSFQKCFSPVWCDSRLWFLVVLICAIIFLRFFSIDDVFEPTDDGSKSKVSWRHLKWINLKHSTPFLFKNTIALPVEGAVPGVARINKWKCVATTAHDIHRILKTFTTLYNWRRKQVKVIIYSTAIQYNVCNRHTEAWRLLINNLKCPDSWGLSPTMCYWPNS